MAVSTFPLASKEEIYSKRAPSEKSTKKHQKSAGSRSKLVKVKIHTRATSNHGKNCSWRQRGPTSTEVFNGSLLLRGTSGQPTSYPGLFCEKGLYTHSYSLFLVYTLTLSFSYTLSLSLSCTHKGNACALTEIQFQVKT